MPRTATLATLSAALCTAGDARDWERLAELSNALAPQLKLLAARAPWSQTELRALAQLRSAHEHAAKACSAALDMLSLQLAELSSNKEGWMAYAIDNGSESGGYQE